MNNLDPMILSKVPYNIYQPNRGYSHNTQLYNFFSKNMKFILSHRIKRQTIRFVKKKKRPRLAFNYRKVKRLTNFRPSIGTRQTSLTFITVAQAHYMTHTMFSPWPYMRDNRLAARRRVKRKLLKLKSVQTLRELKAYKSTIIEDLVIKTIG